MNTRTVNLPRFVGLAALAALSASGLASSASAQIYTEKTLVDFNGVDGSLPSQGVIIDANGNLYGSTEAGGAGSDGTLYSQYGTYFTLNNTGTVANPIYSNTPNTLASVNFNDGRDIYAGITLDSNGNIFGTPSAGGDLTTDGGYGDGSLLEIANNGTAAAPTYAGSSLNEISTFENATGTHPDSGVTFDSHGNIFIAGMGGGNLSLDNGGGAGTIMEYVNTGTLTHPSYASMPITLAIFEDSNGTRPEGTLTIDSHGNLFGTTSQGGNLSLNNGTGDGTVFEIKNTGTIANPNYSTGITTLADFNGSNGSGPAFAVTLDSRGNLFGTTASGTGDDGTVFEIANGGPSAAPTYAGGILTVASFNGTNGSTPESNITIDSSGDLFGTTFNGGDLTTHFGGGSGNVFEIANTGSAGVLNYSAGIKPLFNFDVTDGFEPIGNLALDSTGDLFGTADAGGANGDGVLFELTPAGSTGSAAAAPEPSALLLVLPVIGAASLARACRRKMLRNS